MNVRAPPTTRNGLLFRFYFLDRKVQTTETKVIYPQAKKAIIQSKEFSSKAKPTQQRNGVFFSSKYIKEFCSLQLLGNRVCVDQATRLDHRTTTTTRKSNPIGSKTRDPRLRWNKETENLWIYHPILPAFSHPGFLPTQ